MKVPLLLKLPARLIVPDDAVNVPALIVRPLKVTVLAPKVKAPPPAFVKLYEDPEIVPPVVSVLEVVVIWTEEFIVTAPVPKFKALEPVNMKLAAHVCG